MKSTKRNPQPFRYPGGKYYALNILKPFWEHIPHKEYREPFAGGATIFFNKPKSEINWLNDLDNELICCYKIMQNEQERNRLAIELSKEIASKERWSEMIQDAERTQEERVSAFSTCLAAEYIVRILDDFLGYSYFFEDDEDDID